MARLRGHATAGGGRHAHDQRGHGTDTRRQNGIRSKRPPDSRFVIPIPIPNPFSLMVSFQVRVGKTGPGRAPAGLPS